MRSLTYVLTGLALVVGMVGCGEVDLGEFEAAVDVGAVSLPGSAEFEAKTGRYVMTGSGANMWDTEDQFQFLYRKVSGDFTVSTDLEFISEGGDPHRKAGMMVRESLETDAAYADAIIHGDGLISLQYRRVKGGPTEEIQTPLKAPARLRLQRDGALFSLSVAPGGGDFQPVGALLLELPSETLLGLAVCSHDGSRIEKVAFSGFELSERQAVPEEQRVVESTLETIDISTGERRVVYSALKHFEAPNWSRDGSFLLFNMEGEIYRLPVEGGDPELVETGDARNCNNDHGLSPDGSMLAISHSPEGQSLIYVLPAEGGEPRLVTPNGPSYWHGWSPDGKTLAYCAERNGEYDIYTIPVAGGREKRLTTAEGLDDGPDYSPDGEWIYINSERTGLMKIWRISPDGKQQEQVTLDEDYADWFPHPSPDGKWISFVAYDKSVEGHPPNKAVVLRLMPVEGGEPKVIARLFGGQGTLNVPSWNPESTQFAFVSYRLVSPE